MIVFVRSRFFIELYMFYAPFLQIQAVSDFGSKMRIGNSLFRTTSSLMIHSSMSRRDGSSYIISSMVFSRMERSPLAPDFLSMANLATARRALSVNFNLTFSSSNSFLYCFIMASFGSTSNTHHITFIQLIERGDNGKTADKFGDQSELQKIFRLHLG